MYWWAESGGGSNGAWAVGVKTALVEHGAKPQAVAGVSVGALGAATIGQFKVGEEHAYVRRMHEIWKAVSNERIFRHWFPGGTVGDVIGFLFKPGIYDSSPLHEYVGELLDMKAVRESGRRITVGMVSLTTGSIYYADSADPHTSDDDFRKAVIASASYPAFFAPVEIDGQWWTDGGLRDITPLKRTLALGATSVDVICCQAEDEGKFEAAHKSVMGQLPRMLGIMTDEINDQDLAVTCDDHPHVPIRVFRPAKGLGSGLDFSPDRMKRLMEQGYEDAQKIINGSSRPTRKRTS